MEKVPVINDHDQYVTMPVDQEPTIPVDVIKDHGLKLSKNMKLRMRHLAKVENALDVSEEWKWVDGEAVPPVGRDTDEPYMVADDKKYSDYGTVTVEQVKPYGDNDPAHEVCDTLVVTDADVESNDDEDYKEAVPALAVDHEQFKGVKINYRRGEESKDPINNENYLDRPGMEVKTSETYMSIMEAAESEVEDYPEPSVPDPESEDDPEPIV